MAQPDIAVQRTITVGEPPQAAMERFMNQFTPWFARAKWYVTAQTPTSVSYTNRHFHTWQIVVAILGFPIGLLGLLAEKAQNTVTASFAPHGEGSTAIMLTGNVPPDVTGQLAEQIDAFDPSVAARTVSTAS